MLAVSPLRSSNNKDGNLREGGGSTTMEGSFDDFLDFSGANLLDSIDFDDIFVGMHEIDVLPDLEMDPELLAEFSLSGGDDNNSSSATTMSLENVSPNEVNYGDSNVRYVVDGGLQNSDFLDNEGVKLEHVQTKQNGGLISCNKLPEDEIESKKDSPYSSNSSSIYNEKLKKHKSPSSSKTLRNSNNSNSNNNKGQGKRKTKVDWTPELHRRFVQAVEQLGVDKAVPSRILELMGIDCLTRHNVASHLQKYRSHRKHLLAREAEAASWTHKRQMYGVAMGGGKGGANISPWHPPTIGFPPPMSPMHHHSIRPLHVWGHPTMDPQARTTMWPKHVAPSPTSLTPAWTPPPLPPPINPSFWQAHAPHHRRLTVAPVPGIPPHAMYRPEHGLLPLLAPQNGPHPQLDLHVSKERIDSAIGDVLSKPWLPLPIGLKPPSMDSVLGELQRQGVSKIPPSSSA